MDATFIGALASVRPPDGLRHQIVTAMKVETRTSECAARTKSAPKRAYGWLKPAAVAAAIVLGAFVALELTPGSNDGRVAEDAPDPIPKTTMDEVANRFIHVVADGTKLDFEEKDVRKLNAFLEKQHGPSADGKTLPRGLEGLKSVGCQILKVGKTDASLLCFDADDQTVHLVVVRRKDLDASEWAKLARLEEVKADKRTCRQCPVTKVSVAVWGDDESAFLLLSKTDPDELRKRFF
jgi:hypothetical protein